MLLISKTMRKINKVVVIYQLKKNNNTEVLLQTTIKSIMNINKHIMIKTKIIKSIKITIDKKTLNTEEKTNQN